VYATYLEQARTRYVDRLLGSVVTDGGMVLANLEINFRRPITPEAGSVRVECGVLETGESSFRMGYRVYGDDDSPAATGESVQVAWDGESSRPLPAEWREAVRAFEPGLD
jgi:acyl-CoA thioester hydrolase